MSIFQTMMSKIFGSKKAEASTQMQKDIQATASPSILLQQQTPVNAAPVDVGAVLTELAEKNKEKLNWKQSIVDLMKLLNMDSSLTARKQLAAELHFSGDTNDSASMNIWLHQQVMHKLAENGGKVPAELLKK